MNTTARLSLAPVPVALAAALLAALLYDGTRLWLLTLTVGLLLTAAAAAALTRVTSAGTHVPRSAVPVLLLAWWAWLGLSAAGSQVPYTSLLDLWLKAALILAFAALWLAPAPERTWRLAGGATAIVTAALAVHGACQAWALDLKPSAVFVNPNSFAAFVNLVLLPAVAYLLVASSRAAMIVLGALVLALALAVGLVGSRGALIALLLGLGVLAPVAARKAPARRQIIVGGLVALGLLAANFSAGGVVAERVASLAQPAQAGASRLLIWRQAWAALGDAPWHGFGPGTFWLVYPGYRAPADSSGGYFAHNDYLQLAIESGWPALALLVALMSTVAWRGWRGMREAGTGSARKIEISGLLAGLLATAAHSMLTFNLYVLPTLIAAGLALGRLDLLCSGRKVWALPVPGRLLSVAGLRIVALALIVLPAVHLATMAWASHLYTRARHAAVEEHRLLEAEQLLRRALELAPNVDTHLVGAAEIYRSVLERLPGDAERERRVVFDHAMDFLDRAEALNPLRVQTYRVRGQIMAADPPLPEDEAAQRAQAAFEQALRVDPHHYKTRLDYAQFLLRRGQTGRARAVLEAGLDYWYYPEPPLIAYLAVTAHHLERAGHEARAARVRGRVRRVNQRIARRREAARG